MQGENINITEDGKVYKKLLTKGQEDSRPTKGQEVEGNITINHKS